MKEQSPPSIGQLIDRFEALRLPDARQFDFEKAGGRSAYLASWRSLEMDADMLVKDLLRYATIAKNPRGRSAANKVARHLEKVRLHAGKTTVLHREAAAFIKDRKPSLWEIGQEIFGKKTLRSKWAEAEEKKLRARTKAAEACHHKLLRERELLQIQLEELTG